MLYQQLNQKQQVKSLQQRGHDGSREAKSKVVNHKVYQLKSGGYYVEVSGKIKDIFKAKGVEPINDEELVRKVLKVKKLNGWVMANIKEQLVVKYLPRH